MKYEAPGRVYNGPLGTVGRATRRPHHRVAKVFDELDGGAVVVIERIPLHYAVTYREKT
jgi:hypothetical protein